MTMYWIEKYPKESSFEKFCPHITIGTGEVKGRMECRSARVPPRYLGLTTGNFVEIGSAKSMEGKFDTHAIRNSYSKY